MTEELRPLVRLDSLASIETEGLVGGNYLGVGSGTEGSPAAAPGATIPSKEPFEIAELMQQMGEAIVKANATIQKVNDAIDEMKADVQRAVVSGADTIDIAHKLLTDVSGDLKAMAANGARLSADAATITETVRKGEGSLGKLVNDDELYVRDDECREACRRNCRRRASGRRAGQGSRSPAFSRKTARSKGWPPA